MMFLVQIGAAKVHKHVLSILNYMASFKLNLPILI